MAGWIAFSAEKSRREKLASEEEFCVAAIVEMFCSWGQGNNRGDARISDASASPTGPMKG